MIFVTVGTQLPFDRLIRTMDGWANATGSNVFAQVGPASSYKPCHIRTRADLSPEAFDEAMDEARIIVAHAGMGTILSGLERGKPVIIMLDEFSKGADPVKNMLHPLLEVVNPRLGDVPVPPGSIIFMTGNLSSDGVGDGLKAHTKMRITVVEISKPTAKEWLVWAADNGISPVVMAWVDRNPHALASYRDGDQQGNQYIFMPNTVQGAVVTPRTLELASNIIKMRSSFDHAALQAALAGTVGAPAANSIAAFIAHQDSLPSWKDIIEQPHRTRLPTEQGALAVLVFGAIERVERSSLPQFLDYISRAEEEWQSIFCLGLARSKTKQAMAFTCKAFSDWTVKNEDLL